MVGWLNWGRTIVAKSQLFFVERIVGYDGLCYYDFVFSIFSQGFLSSRWDFTLEDAGKDSRNGI